MALPLAAMMAPAALEAGVSVYQLIKAKQLRDEMEKEGRPVRDIPPELLKALDRVEGLATQRELPGQSAIEDKLRGSTASAADSISKVSTGGEGLGALADIYSGEQRKITDLGIAGEQEWLKKQNMLTAMQGQVAAEQDKNWEYNSAMPWDEKTNERSMLISGGLQNMSGAVNSATNAFVNKYQTDDDWANSINDWVNNIFKRNPNTPSYGNVNLDPNGLNQFAPRGIHY